MSGRDHLQLEPGSGEFARLEAMAAAVDAQLDAEPLPPGAPPPATEAELQANEKAELTAMLCLVSTVAGKACPPLGEAYNAEACDAIATQYLRCAEAYGWTWHKSASSPIVGLVAAAAMPAVLNFDAIRTHVRKQREAREKVAAAAPVASVPVQLREQLADVMPNG